MTEYNVFRYQKVIDNAQIAGGAWVEIGGAEARSAGAAIRDVVERGEDPHVEAEYVAVPARSWQPVTVKIETKTALKFS